MSHVHALSLSPFMESHEVWADRSHSLWTQNEFDNAIRHTQQSHFTTVTHNGGSSMQPAYIDPKLLRLPTATIFHSHEFSPSMQRKLIANHHTDLHTASILTGYSMHSEQHDLLHHELVSHHGPVSHHAMHGYAGHSVLSGGHDTVPHLAHVDSAQEISKLECTPQQGPDQSSDHSSHSHLPEPATSQSQKRRHGFECPHDGCGLQFDRSTQWNQHLLTHAPPKPFACPEPGCDASYSTRSGLRTHSARHNREKKFKCLFEGCHWSFHFQHQLTAHIRKHSGEKPFACSIPGCNKRFAASDTLTRHMRTHTGEKPYECKENGCTLRFAHKSSLNSHILGHSDPKPFKCPDPNCRSEYSYKRSLKKHMLNHSEDK